MYSLKYNLKLRTLYNLMKDYIINLKKIDLYI